MTTTTRRKAWQTAVTLVLLFLFAALASGATVGGSLRYGGMPVTSTITTMTSGVAAVYNWTTSAYAYGTVNIAANSYSISGVAAGSYSLFVRLSRSSVGQDVIPAPGDLYVGANLTVGSETTITKDLDLLYAIHVTQPLDDATRWSGSCSVCPQGAEVAKTFTLAWEPVPLASEYRVAVSRWSCADRQVGFDGQTVTTTSAQVSQQTTTDEDHITVNVDAFTGTTQLTVQPYVAYTGCWWQTHAFHAPSSQTGRSVHPINSRFIIQVAHVGGVPPTFWKSDLFLTNPIPSAITATLTFTPRGADGTQNYQQAQVDVPANGSRAVTDVLDALFHGSGAGSLEVSPATLEAATRCYTPGAGSGTYGQDYLPIPNDQIAYTGGAGIRLGAGGVVKGSYRTNLALVEVWGEAVQLHVRLLDRDGNQIGETTVSLLPFGNTQINDVVGSLGGPQTLAEGQVTVDVTGGSGRVAGCLSVIDNSSQDPTTVPLNRR